MCRAYRVQKDDITKLFFGFQCFGYHVSVEHDKKTSTAQIGWESVQGGPEIWPHGYLISPIEISVNWPGSKQL